MNRKEDNKGHCVCLGKELKSFKENTAPQKKIRLRDGANGTETCLGVTFVGAVKSHLRELKEKGRAVA